MSKKKKADKKRGKLRGGIIIARANEGLPFGFASSSLEDFMARCKVVRGSALAPLSAPPGASDARHKDYDIDLLRGVLDKAATQIEYLHERLGTETATGNQMLALIAQVLHQTQSQTTAPISPRPFDLPTEAPEETPPPPAAPE